MRSSRRLRITWRATAIALACLALLWAVIAASAPIPLIEQRIGDTSLRFTADRAWAWLPGDCVALQWQVEGIESLYVEGQGVVGKGEIAFCPSASDRSARFDVRTPDGLYREYELRVQFLPDLIFYLAGFIGTVGSLGLMGYFVIANRLEGALNPRWIVLCVAALVLVGTALRLNEPLPPRMDAIDGPVKVAMWAEQARLVFPQEPVEVEFSVVGAESLRYRGSEIELRDGWEQAVYHDAHGSAFQLEATGMDGETRFFELPMPSVFGGLRDSPVIKYWSLLALAVAAFVFLPIGWRKARDKWLRREWTDFVALAAFAFLALMIYAPFGLNSLPTYENWGWWAKFEGFVEAYSTELPTRPFMALPPSLGHFLSRDSYIGFHVMQVALMTLQPLAMYGLLRKLGLGGLYAFLLATLFFVYPVNTWKLTPRFAFNTLNVIWLLLAGFCALEWLENPRRRTLAGMALGLLFCMFSYEVGLPLMVLLPFVLWLRRDKLCRRRVHLALLLWSVAVVKVSWMMLLTATDRPMYKSRLLGAFDALGDPAQAQAFIEATLRRLARVYQHTFVDSWNNALSGLAGGEWLLPTLLAWLAIAAAAIWLLRRDGQLREASLRLNALALAGGLLAVTLAVATLITVPVYGDVIMGRLYLYVPVGGAITAFSLSLLLARLVKRRWRDSALLVLCLLLTLPGVSWLFAEKAEWTLTAANQGSVLRQTLELAPQPHPDTHLVVFAEMSRDELDALRVNTLRFGWNFEAAMRVLYEGRFPRSAYLCRLPDKCRSDAAGVMREPAHALVEARQHALVMELHGDLTLELLEDPFARLGWAGKGDYDASRLHDADAPLPQRANLLAR